MFDWFFTLNSADKIALFALIVASYGAILSTILYRKEKLKLKFINLGVNFVTLSPGDVTVNNMGVQCVTFNENLYTVVLLVRINNCSKSPVTITDLILNKKYMFNSFSSKDFTHIPTSFKRFYDFLISNDSKYIKDRIIQPLIKLEPLSTCEGFIIFSNLDEIPKKFKIIINTVQKSKTFKFNFTIDKDFRNHIVE